MTKFDRFALLTFADAVRGRHLWAPLAFTQRLWWHAIDILPYPVDMPVVLARWADVAESMAYDGRPVTQ